MFLVPLGLEAKTLQTPWATFVVVVIISFFSILNRGLSDQLYEIYLHSNERLAYQRELKSFLDERCVQELRPPICEQFQKSILPEHLMSMEMFQSVRPPMPEKDARELFAFVKPWLNEDQLPHFKEDPPHLQDVLNRLQALHNRVASFLVQNEVLSSERLTWWSLLKSQFLHSGFFHLFGNLVFLLLLAFPVEQRLGAWRYLAVYFVAGFAGMALQAAVGGYSVMIVGASANIFGVGGAFLALFARHRMRILVSFFLLNQQTVVIPVLAYFTCWFLGEEILGLLQSSDGIAHFAHLGGFVAGALAAWFFDRFPRLPADYTYPYEKDFQNRLDRAENDEERLGIFNHWLGVNPASPVAAKNSLDVIHRLLESHSETPTLTQFHTRIWPDLWERHMGQPEILERVPLTWLSTTPLQIDAPQIARILQAHHQKKNFWCEWLILYQVLSSQAAEVPFEWERRFYDLGQMMSKDPERLTWLQENCRRFPEFKKFLESKGLWTRDRGGQHAG